MFDVVVWRGQWLHEYHGNGIGTENRYHPTRGFLERSRTMRWDALNAPVQEDEMQLDDLGNVLWRREQRFAPLPFHPACADREPWL